MIRAREERNTWRKTYLIATFIINPTWTGLGLNTGLMPTTVCLSHDTASCVRGLFILETYFHEWKIVNLGWRRLASDKIQQSSTLNVLIPRGAECAFDHKNFKNYGKLEVSK
jgi:hypothetical protein